MVILCHYTLSLQPLSPPPSEVCSDVFMCTEYIKKNSSVHYKTDSLLAPTLCWQLFQGRLASASMESRADKCLSHETHFLFFFFMKNCPCNLFSGHAAHLDLAFLSMAILILIYYFKDVVLHLVRHTSKSKLSKSPEPLMPSVSALSIRIHWTLDNN